MKAKILYLEYLAESLSDEQKRYRDGANKIHNHLSDLGQHSKKIDFEQKKEILEKYQAKTLPQKRTVKEHPRWAKDLHKSIVRKTHPDKTDNNNDLFFETKNAMDINDYASLLIIARKLDIEITDEEDISKEIDRKVSEITERISEIKRTISWQWKEYNKEKKIESLEFILNQLGIDATKQNVKEIFSRPEKRKKGTRPPK